MDCARGAPPRPLNLRAEATVVDVNRQAWTSGVNLLVHPAALYVGLKSERTFVAGGGALPVDARVSHPGGGGGGGGGGAAGGGPPAFGREGGGLEGQNRATPA